MLFFRLVVQKEWICWTVTSTASELNANSREISCDVKQRKETIKQRTEKETSKKYLGWFFFDDSALIPCA